MRVQGERRVWRITNSVHLLHVKKNIKNNIAKSGGKYMGLCGFGFNRCMGLRQSRWWGRRGCGCRDWW